MPPGRLLVETTQATAARDEEVFGDLIRVTSDILTDYTDDELVVIRDFLDRVRQVTAAHADALGSHARPGPGHAETTRRSRARGSTVNDSPSSATAGQNLLHRRVTWIVACMRMVISSGVRGWCAGRGRVASVRRHRPGRHRPTG